MDNTSLAFSAHKINDYVMEYYNNYLTFICINYAGVAISGSTTGFYELGIVTHKPITRIITSVQQDNNNDTRCIMFYTVVEPNGALHIWLNTANTKYHPRDSFWYLNAN